MKKRRIYIDMDGVLAVFNPDKSLEEVAMPGYFRENLREWHGVAIKLMNGINGTKGTWCGYSVNGRAKPDVIRNTLLGIALTS